MEGEKLLRRCVNGRTLCQRGTKLNNATVPPVRRHVVYLASSASHRQLRILGAQAHAVLIVSGSRHMSSERGNLRIYAYSFEDIIRAIKRCVQGVREVGKVCELECNNNLVESYRNKASHMIENTATDFTAVTTTVSARISGTQCLL